MFTEAPFTIARTWKQPKCSSTEKWIKKIVCVSVCVCVYIESVSCSAMSYLQLHGL